MIKNKGSEKRLFYASCTLFRANERSDFIILSRAKRARSLLTTRGLSQLRNSRLHKEIFLSLNNFMLGIRQ